MTDGGPSRPEPRRRPAVAGPGITRRTALALPDSMSLGEWSRLGRQIFTISDSSSWWLGDWLIYGQAHFPDRYKRAIAETGLDYQTLRNYAWVSRRVAHRRRRDKLSFQHHAEVAGLAEDQQDGWLDQAEEHGWSRNELRRRVKAARLGVRAGQEVLHIQMNVVAGRKKVWQEAADSAEQDLLAWISTSLDEAARAALESRERFAQLGTGSGLTED
ncbi:LmbU family transcriptional regulator [Nonomuraea sp. NN258]|uniref:LmbU family transcriptional regulator n=1 Tax=Nonomuraea antri TaxID=2730852 RepID=UPI00156936C7|nr:LmbU family transcriptional regulator [Nonomuraea antri]NRQ31674.1 LmbU family transcriptional regulator [Nonomuraea antri]